MFQQKLKNKRLFVIAQNKDNKKVKKFNKVVIIFTSLFLMVSSHSYASMLNEKTSAPVFNNNIQKDPFHIRNSAQSSVFSDTKIYSKNPVINGFLNAPYTFNNEKIPLPTAKDFKTKTVNGKQKLLAKVISDQYGISSDKALNVVKTAYQVSSQNNIDPIVLLSITAVESKFNDKARNRSGAVGLVQAMPSAHPEKIKDIKKRGNSLYDIQENLNLGAKIYSECLEKANGNQKQALQRYNGSVKDKKQLYAKKVLLAMTPFKKALSQDPIS